MRRLIAFFFVIGCYATSAAEIGHWVIGSFSDRENAEQEAERLHQLLGTPIKVSPHPDQSLFRLIVRQNLISKDDLAKYGFGSWTIYVEEEEEENKHEKEEDLEEHVNKEHVNKEHHQDQALPPPISEEKNIQANIRRDNGNQHQHAQLEQLGAASEPTPENIQHEQKKPTRDEPLYPEIRAGESLIAYCQRIPESPLCMHPSMKNMLQRLKKLEQRKLTLQNECSNPESEREVEICREVDD